MNFGKYLAMFFGCHQKPERSFFFRGKQFPICARCTGMLIGMIVGIMTFFLNNSINIIFILVLPIPGILDGLIQLKTQYESNNIKRLLTGLLMGFAVTYLFVYSLWIVYKFGYNVGGLFE